VLRALDRSIDNQAGVLSQDRIDGFIASTVWIWFRLTVGAAFYSAYHHVMCWLQLKCINQVTLKSAFFRNGIRSFITMFSAFNLYFAKLYNINL